MPILLLTVVLLSLQRRLLARRGYVSVSGKGGERRPFDIGWWKWVLLAYSVLVAALAVVMPLALQGRPHQHTWMALCWATTVGLIGE